MTTTSMPAHVQDFSIAADVLERLGSPTEEALIAFVRNRQGLCQAACEAGFGEFLFNESLRKQWAAYPAEMIQGFLRLGDDLAAWSEALTLLGV
jgi:hypothetical protein